MVPILTTQTVIRATRSQAISENRIYAIFQATVQFWVALIKYLSTLFLKCPNTLFKTDGQRFTSELSTQFHFAREAVTSLCSHPVHPPPRTAEEVSFCLQDRSWKA